MCKWQTRDRYFFVLLILILTIGFTGRGVLLAKKKSLEEDEVYTYLTATGHARDFIDPPSTKPVPYDIWEQHATWYAFVKPDKLFMFGPISRDLAEFDIHPPFYFWVMNMWLELSGTGINRGPAINLLLDFMVVLAWGALGSAVFKNWYEGLLPACLWTLSPISIRTTLIARHYTLFAALSVIYIGLLYTSFYRDETRKPTRFQLMGLVLMGTIGLLTHFQFVVLIGLSVVLVCWQHKDTTKRRYIVLTSIVAGMLFVAIHPGFTNSLQRQQDMARTYNFSQAEIKLRLHIVANQLPRVVTDNPYLFQISSHYKMYALALGAILGLIVGYFSGILSWLIHGAKDKVFLLLIATTNFAVVFFLYLTTLTPGHAMSFRYLSQPWALGVFMPVMLFRLPLLKRYQTSLLLILYLGMIVAGIDTITRQIEYQNNLNRGYQPITTERVVIEQGSGNDVFPGIFYTEPNQSVMVGSFTYLRDNPTAWLPQNAEERVLLIPSAPTRWSPTLSFIGAQNVEKEKILLFSRTAYWLTCACQQPID